MDKNVVQPSHSMHLSPFYFLLVLLCRDNSEEFAREEYEYMRLDALVAERLTASPHIVDVYGLCGTATLSELFAHGDVNEAAFGSEDDDKKVDHRLSPYWPPKNELTGLEKLEISLSLAEAVADLHGSASGVIVHQDTKSMYQ